MEKNNQEKGTFRNKKYEELFHIQEKLNEQLAITLVDTKDSSSKKIKKLEDRVESQSMTIVSLARLVHGALHVGQFEFCDHESCLMSKLNAAGSLIQEFNNHNNMNSISDIADRMEEMSAEVSELEELEEDESENEDE